MPLTTLITLLDNVGAKLHVTLGASSVPTKAQATQWLNDAQMEIARLRNLPELTVIYTPSASTVATSVAAPTNLMRIINAYDNFNNKQLYPINWDVYTRIITGSDSYYTTSSYCYIIGDNSGVRTIYYYPESDPSEKTFIYIKYPTEMSNDTDTMGIGDEWASMLVDYAVIQGRVQTEDYDKVKLLLNDWYAKLGFDVTGGTRDSQGT